MVRYIYLISVIFQVLFLDTGYPQDTKIHRNDSMVIISNEVITREISIKNGKIKTTLLQLLQERSKHPFINENNEILEFQFLLNDNVVNGESGWNIRGIEEICHDNGGKYLKIRAFGTKRINQKIEIVLHYIVYPGLPIIRKRLDIQNNRNEEIRIEGVDVEKIILPWGATENLIFCNYARNKRLGPYIGDWDDPLVICHNQPGKQGIALGNEAPGVLKRTDALLDGKTISVGLTHPSQEYAFRAWLNPGEDWESTWTFLGLYKGVDPEIFKNGPLNDFTRKFLNTRLSLITNIPLFVYNTWKPFRREINEALIYELATAASECGVDKFVIDDGWQRNYLESDSYFQWGDWIVDEKKFPNGLKPVFDSIKSLGMKPGIWLSMAAASPDSKVFKNHPEWFTLNKSGEFANLHRNSKERFSACFTTEWKDYIKEIILNMVKEYGLEYVKLDFAIVTSAYRFDRSASGCYAPNHPHKDREESLLEIYRSAWKMFDELHEETPDLFIDCTFETMGALQMIDYDMCKHAEGNWLSNFEESVPDGSLRVRQMAWWRSPVIPASTLVIGNQSLNDPGYKLAFKSLTGTLPVMLGDLRKLTENERAELKMLSDRLQQAHSKHQFMLFRQDLQGFGEPKKFGWDGFQRINTETKSGGIVGIFRQGANEDRKLVFINGLNPVASYKLINMESGETLTIMNGEDFYEEGFNAIIEMSYGGKIYEIRRVEE